MHSWLVKMQVKGQAQNIKKFKTQPSHLLPNVSAVAFQLRAANLVSRGSTTKEGFNRINHCVVSAMGVWYPYLAA
jgi:hypothetical protein